MSKQRPLSHRKLAVASNVACACCLAVTACNDDPKSKALPPKYFRLDMDLKINNRDYPISYNWHCEQVVWRGESQFLLPIAANPKSAMWAWSSSAVSTFNERLDAETFFSVLLPDIQWCNQNYRGDKSYDHPSVVVVKTVPSAIGSESFDKEHEHGPDYNVNIGSAVVHRLEEKARDTEFSNEERNLRQVVTSLGLAYQIVDAVVIPSNEVSWPKTSIEDYFRGAHGLVVAAIPTHTANKSNGWEDRRFFEVDQSVPDPSAWFEFKLRHRQAMTRQGDVWRFPAPMDSHLAFAHYTIPSSPGIAGAIASSCPEVRIEYEGTPIPVMEVQQIYDAEKLLLITFTNHCSVPSFGSIAK
jgi:hypothetical protein